MSTALMVVIAVVAVVIVAGGGFLAWRQGRTQRLRRRFGPEYDRAIERHGNRGAAERELLSREERHRELDIRPLDPRQRELYREQWTRVQEQFVDTPEAAVEQADRLVTTVMGERGYPTKDFDDQVSFLSVEHGRTLDHYRRGHDISDRATRKEASTEDLRQAMVHYRALFEDLLAVPEEERAARPAPAPAEAAEAERTTQGERTADTAEAERNAQTDRTANAERDAETDRDAAAERDPEAERAAAAEREAKAEHRGRRS